MIDNATRANRRMAGKRESATTGPKIESLASAQSKENAESRVRAKQMVACIASAATVLLVTLGGALLYAQGQDKYLLKSPSGIAFSDFKGYEDWSVISSARTDEVLKVIVGNPAAIRAYKSGVPGNGQPFPQGSMIAKLQWAPKKSADATFAVDVPDTFKQAFVMEKDNKRFPKTGGWGYAVFNYDRGKFSPDPTALEGCGQTCHVAVKAKDYVFHPYQAR